MSDIHTETLPASVFKAFLPVAELLRSSRAGWTVHMHPRDHSNLVAQTREDTFPQLVTDGLTTIIGFPVTMDESVRPGFLRAVRDPGTVIEIRIETSYATVCEGCGAIVPNLEEWSPFAFAVRCGKCSASILALV